MKNIINQNQSKKAPQSSKGKQAVAVLNAALEVSANAIECGATIPKALEEGILHIRKSKVYKVLNVSQKKEVEDKFRAAIYECTSDIEDITAKDIINVVESHFSDRKKQVMSLRDRLVEALCLDVEIAAEIEKMLLMGVREKVESRLRLILGLDNLEEQGLISNQQEVVLDSILDSIKFGAVPPEEFKKHF